MMSELMKVTEVGERMLEAIFSYGWWNKEEEYEGCVLGFLGFRLSAGEEESETRVKIKKAEEGSQCHVHSAWHFKWNGIKEAVPREEWAAYEEMTDPKQSTGSRLHGSEEKDEKRRHIVLTSGLRFGGPNWLAVRKKGERCALGFWWPGPKPWE